MAVRRERGFTMLELVVVMAIIAMAMALILTVSGKGASSADLKASARSLAAGLRAAQSNAMVGRRDALLTIDVEQRLYTFSGEDRTHKLPDGVDLKLYTAQAEVESEKRGSIRFFPDGSSTGGRITVASGERKFLVDVDWLTGRVSIGE